MHHVRHRYRPGFDVSFPLLPNGVATTVTPAELKAAEPKRDLLVSFKGDRHTRTPSALPTHRARLPSAHC